MQNISFRDFQKKYFPDQKLTKEEEEFIDKVDSLTAEHRDDCTCDFCLKEAINKLDYEI